MIRLGALMRVVPVVALSLTLMLASTVGAQGKARASVGAGEAASFVPAIEASAPRSINALLDATRRGERVVVIVGVDVPLLTDGAGIASIAQQRTAIRSVQQELLASLSDDVATSATRLTSIPYLILEADEASLRTIASHPTVVTVEEDRLAFPLLQESVPLIGADVARDNGQTGDGYAVAIFDTGVDARHPFLSGSVTAGACFSGEGGTNVAGSLCSNGEAVEIGVGAGAPCSGLPGCEHGTHVAGIVAGSAPQIVGVAPGANIIAVQVFTNFDGSLASALSDRLRAFDHIAQLVDAGTRVAAVNMSLGGGMFDSEASCDEANASEKAAVDALIARGVATIAASGNDGLTAAMSAPACISSVVSVGSTTKLDVVSSFSSHADFLDLLAPGSAITSSVPGNAYASFDGTSMAVPHVAGAWAVMLDADPTLTVDEVLARLVESGTPIVDARSGTATGFAPRIDVDRAIRGAVVPGAWVIYRVFVSVTPGCPERRSTIMISATPGAEVIACHEVVNIGHENLVALELASSDGLLELSETVVVQPGTTWTHQHAIPTQSLADEATWTLDATSVTAGATVSAETRHVKVDHLSRNRIDIDGQGAAVVSDTIVVDASDDVAVGLELAIHVEHAWLGDLNVTLEHVETGTSVEIVGNRFGFDWCSASGGMLARFTDGADRDPYVWCEVDGGLVNGPYTPDQPLSAFDDGPVGGTWRLTVTDEYPGLDFGRLLGWGIRVSSTPTTDVARIVPSASDCASTIVGGTCSLTVGIVDASGYGPASGFQVTLDVPGFDVIPDSAVPVDLGLAASCTVANGSSIVGAICSDAFSGDGGLVDVTLERTEEGATSVTTRDGLIVLTSTGADVVVAGGTLRMDWLTCDEASFAEFSLGDFNQSRSMTAGDALGILWTAVGTISEPTEYEAYHADVDGSGDVTAPDALLALYKAVDPERPASLQVAPKQLLVAEGGYACALVGNAGNGSLGAVSVEATEGLTVEDVTPANAVGRVYAIMLTDGDGGSVTFRAGTAGSKTVTVVMASSEP